jgi:hypothetical protein
MAHSSKSLPVCPTHERSSVYSVLVTITSNGEACALSFPSFVFPILLCSLSPFLSLSLSLSLSHPFSPYLSLSPSLCSLALSLTLPILFPTLELSSLTSCSEKLFGVIFQKRSYADEVHMGAIQEDHSWRPLPLLQDNYLTVVDVPECTREDELELRTTCEDNVSNTNTDMILSNSHWHKWTYVIENWFIETMNGLSLIYQT